MRALTFVPGAGRHSDSPYRLQGLLTKDAHEWHFQIRQQICPQYVACFTRQLRKEANAQTAPDHHPPRASETQRLREMSCSRRLCGDCERTDELGVVIFPTSLGLVWLVAMPPLGKERRFFPPQGGGDLFP